MSNQELIELDENGNQIESRNVHISEVESGTDPDDPRNEYSKTHEGPEDNDGENRHPKKEERSSKNDVIISIVKSCVGCGILNMPITVQAFGVIPSIFIFGFGALLTAFSVRLMMKVKDSTQRYGYSMYAKLSFGTVGTIGMKLCIITKCLGTCCVLLRTFGGVCGEIVSSVLVADDSFYFQQNFYCLVIFLVLAPLMFMDDISGLKKFSFLGVLCVFSFVICIFIKYFVKAIQEKSLLFTSEMMYPIDIHDYSSLFQKLTSLINSFYFHMNIFPFYLPLHPRKSHTMFSAASIASIIVGLLYYFVGMSAYALYKKNLQSSILPNLKTDLQGLLQIKNKSGLDYFLIVVTFFGMCTFFISALLSTPLIFFSLKKNLINLIRMIKNKITETKTNDENSMTNTMDKKDLEDMANTKAVLESESAFPKFVITALAYVSVLICTLNVNQIIVINSIAGSTVGNLISTVCPGMFCLILCKDKKCSFTKNLATFYVVFGVIILSLFIKINIFDAFFLKK